MGNIFFLASLQCCSTGHWSCFLVSHHILNVFLMCISFLLQLQQIMTNVLALNNTNLLSGVQKSEMSLRGLRSRHQQACVLACGSRGSSVSLPFLATRDLLHCLAHRSLTPLSKHITPTSASVISFFWLWSSCLPLIRSPWDYMGPPGYSRLISPLQDP